MVEAFGDAGEVGEVHILRDVFVGVVEVVAVGGGVSDHERVIAHAPETPVIARANMRNDGGQARADAGERGTLAECGDALRYEVLGFAHAHEGDEVAFTGEKRLEKRFEWIALRAFVMQIAADGFGREHADDVVVAGAGGFGVDEAAHLLGPKEWWFFVGPEREAEGARVWLARVGSRGGAVSKCNGAGDATAVVVGGGAKAELWFEFDGVVVSADDDDFVAFGGAWELNFEIGDALAVAGVFLTRDAQACVSKLRGEELFAASQQRRAKLVATCERACELAHDGFELVGELRVRCGKRREIALMAGAGHCGDEARQQRCAANAGERGGEFGAVQGLVSRLGEFFEHAEEYQSGEEAAKRLRGKSAIGKVRDESERARMRRDSTQAGGNLYLHHAATGRAGLWPAHSGCAVAYGKFAG